MATHDLTRRYLGHDFSFTPIDKGYKGRMAVWNSKWIREGDYLILPHDGGTTRYRADSVRRVIDPPDQMFLDVTFAPRTEEDES